MSGESNVSNLDAGRFVDRVPLAAVASPNEETAGAVMHAAASLGAIAAIVIFMREALAAGTILPVVALAVFGLTLFNLYAVSAVYHFLKVGRMKRLFRVFDHVSVLYLIAGSYTVVVLLFLQGPLRWIMFSAEWGLALGGTVYKIFFLGRIRTISMVLYLVMGWMVLLAWQQMVTLRIGDLNIWLLIGGIAYTTGLIFFGLKKLPYHHAVWHLFVMAGSACHIVGIYQAVRVLYG